MNRDCANRRGLDLFKEVLWVFVGQKAAELPAVKVGSQKKILPIGPIQTQISRTGLSGRIFLNLKLFV